MARTSSAMKIGSLDTRISCENSPCWKCKHFGNAKYFYSCSIYPEEIPENIWNNKKKCPKREERE